MKVLRTITVGQDIKDLKGWGISAGTALHILKEGPVHPVFGYKLLVVRVDNGTGDLELMPETVVKDVDIETAKAKRKPSIRRLRK